MKAKFKSFILLLIAFSICTNIYAFGANDDYLKYENWYSNPKINTENIKKSSRGNSLTGNFSYYVDNETMTVYTCIVFDETTYSNKNDDVRVQYSFAMSEDTYTFSVNSDGVIEGNSSLFTVNQNFFTLDDTPQAISYAQYNGKSATGKIKVFLFVNNTRYLLNDSIPVEKPSTTKPVTTKAEKTTKAKTTKVKTTKKKTTKKSKKTTKKKATKAAAKINNMTKTSASSETESKYSVSVSKISAEVPANSEASTSNNAETAQIKGNLSKSSLGLIIFASVLAIIALLIIFYNIGAANAKSKDDKNDDSE